VVVPPASRVGGGLLLELYEGAVAAAAPGPATARAIEALDIDRSRRIWIFALGKAARPMAAAAVQTALRSLHSIVGGVVVAPDDGPSPYPTIHSLRGDHPIPGRHSFDAAAKIADVAAGRRGTDVAVVLLSGGATSLVGAPVRGIPEADFIALHELLLGSGLDIAQMNAVRKRFSRWSAGRLALALAPATTHCLAISDVQGDDPGVIGSGPCVPDANNVQHVTEILQRANLLSRLPRSVREYLSAVTRRTIPETPARGHPAFAHVAVRVIGNNAMAREGAAAAARARGHEPEIVPEWVSGEAARAGEAIARDLIARRARGDAGVCVVWGGESTVTLTGTGASTAGGGRCQELALAAARVLRQAADAAAGIGLLAAGTDGRDGATDAAGAIVDATTWAAISDAAVNPAHALAEHRSYAALRAAGALIPRRDTGTNVNDVMIGTIAR
jgi:hydroxypyruvate reductase